MKQVRQTKYSRCRDKFQKYFRAVPKVNSKTGRSSTVIRLGMYTDFVKEISSCSILESEPEVKVLLLVLYSTGIRISEALRLKVGQVNIQKRRITQIKLSKKRRDFYMDKPIHPQALEKLAQFLEGKGSNENLFPNIADRFQARRRIRAYLGDLTTHDTRHSFISRAVNEGSAKKEKYTTAELAKMCGFERLENATTYLNVETDVLFDEMFDEVA
ncbi:MAG: tyrosine-type recombinase/integrase [Bdellovibrionales bacterium]|nr:tyrosine-type recombinase/integrase [Bdellovibrionales bacterium]